MRRQATALGRLLEAKPIRQDFGVLFANLSSAHRMSAGKINNVLVDFNFCGSTEDFKKYFDPFPGGN